MPEPHAPTDPATQTGGIGGHKRARISVEDAIREAIRLMTADGVEIRPAKLSRIIRRFLAAGHTTVAEVEMYLMTYADPTGETAVGNVARGNHRG